jgi:Zn ribbon nucleic-acid-binding protein
MTSLADIIRQHGPAYQAQYAAKLLPSHRRTMQDIVDCQTAVMGGHLYHCDACDTEHYQYHSCQNRHCPQCQHRKGQHWLEQQCETLLPVPYFMTTFTIPSELHQLARRHQKIVYGILFRTSAEALKQLAQDPRYVGGEIGMVGVLHTWGRDLSYHPHVHYLVPAGGLSFDGERWVSAKHNFLVPVKALSIIFRAKFRDALRKAELLDEVNPQVWQQDWVTHCQSVGKGEGALKYLAPYVFRVAISNQRILKLKNGRVTFRYRASDTGRWQRMTVSAHEFLRRFLQHTLPKGFVKVRYYGLFSPSRRHLLPLLRLWLGDDGDENKAADVDPEDSLSVATCPTCGHPMRWIREIPPRARCPPPAG